MTETSNPGVTGEAAAAVNCEPHQWAHHGTDSTVIRWVPICMVCGRIDGASLDRQVAGFAMNDARPMLTATINGQAGVRRVEKEKERAVDNRGLYAKYTVERTDGQDQPGGKHEGCRLFILDPRHDPSARHAIEAYAQDVEDARPMLAADLRDWLASIP